MSTVILTGLLELHTASTLLLAGLIWTIQLVHYPLFARVGADAFPAYQQQHARRITWLVGPLMAAEAGAAVALFLLLDGPRLRLLAALGLLLVILIWVSTALLQVPCHARLRRGFDPRAWRRLVGTNWIRTVAWSVRGVLALLLCRLAN